MKKFLTTLLLAPAFSVLALPNGAPVCAVEADFDNITGMQSRVRNQNTGDFVVSAPAEYTPGATLQFTITGPTFTGVMFTVVDGTDQSVGTFSIDVSTNSCNPGTMAITHSSSFGNVMSKTLDWTAPDPGVGPVFIEGYVLSGSRGDQASQQFYRFVTDDDSAETMLQSGDLIFVDSFE